ncbi:MAG: hypothetical protein Q7K39_04735 [Candidatus Magasanikbacteria bacterium]|nr:hypothetical protein [Candidatus Magasanikbacteria bacterium]
MSNIDAYREAKEALIKRLGNPDGVEYFVRMAEPSDRVGDLPMVVVAKRGRQEIGLEGYRATITSALPEPDGNGIISSASAPPDLPASSTRP